MGRFDEVHARSMKDPEGFWGEAAAKVHWYRPWDMVLDDRSAPFYHWFTGGLTNTCFNALDRHVEGGRAEQQRDHLAVVGRGVVEADLAQVGRGHGRGIVARGGSGCQGSRV